MSIDIFPRESRLLRLKAMSSTPGAIMTVSGNTIIITGTELARRDCLTRAKTAAGIMGCEISTTHSHMNTADSTTVITVEARVS
jgi:hypothetical protein